MPELSAEEKNARMSQERAVLTKLLESALQGDFDKLKTVVEDYCRQHDKITATEVLTQFRDGKRRAALHFACQSVPAKTKDDDQDIVEKMLLSKWLPASSVQLMLTLKDKDGITPLMFAAQLDHPEIVEKRITTLLEAASMTSTGKLALARSHAGATPLHYAAGAGATARSSKHLRSRSRGHFYLFAAGRNTCTGRCAATNRTIIRKTIVVCWITVPISMLPAMHHKTWFLHPWSWRLQPGTTIGNVWSSRHGKRKIDLHPTLEFPVTRQVTVFHMAADMNPLERWPCY
jgi:hypothetical protein